MLGLRRDQLRRQVQGTIQDVRARIDQDSDVPGAGENLEADFGEDIDLALIEMKSETLRKIDTALDRLEQGSYGSCAECGGQITEARLRALPFALRCRRCEEVRETTGRRPVPTNFPDFDP
jgi:DnaK suppressor protein